MKLGRDIARRFAETMLFWRGHLRAEDVGRFLGVSERTARSLISDWRFAGLLPRYRQNAERWLVPSEHFDPSPCVVDPAITFSLLLCAEHFPGNPFASTPLPAGGHDLSLSASVPMGPTREILAACLDRQAVSLIYAAKTGRQDFVFCPSALIRARGRYHLRGRRLEGSDALGRRLPPRYIDVIPARAVEAQRSKETLFVGIEDDDDWHTFERRRFVLSPALSVEERLCYEHEYGIADLGELVVDQRRALMRYVLQELSERRCWRRAGAWVPIWDMNSVPPT